MKKPSNRTIRWIAIGTALLVVLLLLLGVHRSRRLQTSLESGRFEARYTAAIDALQTQTRSLREKLRANSPGNLEILSEELLRPAKTASVHLENQGKPTLENIKLRGIYWSSSMPLAEINDRLCKTGEKIAGFTLEEIQPYQIILSDSEGGKQTVSLIKDL